MSRLSGALAYLCGPMDRVSDRGVEWREDMTKFLHGLGCGVLNPVDKPTNFAPEDEHVYATINSLKESIRRNSDNTSARNALSMIMQDIVRMDLRMIDVAHFVIMNLDTSVHMCGSYGEQSVACLQKKPVIIHCPQGLHDIPNWIWGICKHEMFFDHWDDVKTYLLSIHKGTDTNHLNRWRFFDWEKVYGR